MVMLSKPTLPCDEVFLDAVLGSVLAVDGQAVRHRDPAPPTVAPTRVIASHEPESKIRNEVDLRDHSLRTSAPRGGGGLAQKQKN